MTATGPTPSPTAPSTTWRDLLLDQLGRDVFGRRARALFGPTDAPADADMFDPRHWPDAPITAEGGLAMLEEGYRSWRAGIERLDDQSLLRPIGPKGAGFAEFPMAALVTHLSREAMAHGGEICLLRDLYRAQASPSG